MSVNRNLQHSIRLVSGWEITSLALLAVIVFGFDSSYLDIPVAIFNISVSATLIAILSMGCYWSINNTRAVLWTPVFWFRISSAVYCGFGAIVPYIVGSNTERFMKFLWNYNDADILKLSQIYIVCILTTLVVAYFFRHKFAEPSQDRGRWSKRRHLQIAITFLIAGAVIRYAINIPTLFGLSNFRLPGGIDALGYSYQAGLFLLMLYGFRCNLGLLITAALLSMIDIFFGVLTFQKTDVLITLIFSYLAVIYYKFSMFRVAVGSIVVGLTFAQLQPLVHFGRDMVSEMSGRPWDAAGKVQEVATLDQRINIISLFFEKESSPSDFTGFNDPLLRLSYVNAGAMVVNWHDQGSDINTYSNLLIVLVPRIFWPGKPQVGSAGGELYVAARGRAGASISAGLFAESYLNLGRAGFLMFIPVGLLLGAISLFALRSVEREQWLRLPVILYGVLIGTRVDGHYVTDIAGAAAVWGVLVIIFLVIEYVFALWFNSRSGAVQPMSANYGYQ